MEELTLKLPVFEGPLDLLLHLIKTAKVSIDDIPIVEITEQYLNYLHTFELLELDVAGDYLVMAATLMRIKSKMLLPVSPIEEIENEVPEALDPRMDLVEQLRTYQAYKAAAVDLQDKEEQRQAMFSKAPSLLAYEHQERIPMPEKGVNIQDLMLAFSKMLATQKAKEPARVSLQAENISIEEKMVDIKKMLSDQSNSMLNFEELFEHPSQELIITTFLAILELSKKGEVVLQQLSFDEHITVQLRFEEKNV